MWGSMELDIDIHLRHPDALIFPPSFWLPSLLLFCTAIPCKMSSSRATDMPTQHYDTGVTQYKAGQWGEAVRSFDRVRSGLCFGEPYVPATRPTSSR